VKLCRAAAFLLAAWTVILLSLAVASFAFHRFFIEPDNVRLTMTMNWLERVGVGAVAVLILLLAVYCADFCFAKNRELRCGAATAKSR
jgi:hypothetical protein